ncbi:hypothetical protein [Oryza sativa Japonica Group]|uniref:Uncharacterized protein n=1 Tax=Oryza sativa subsp. japonica TaxID=39947 RepID=Q5JMT1_ORYSJ|nr:hypothetical protein [Oryza sativa Japonica Group]
MGKRMCSPGCGGSSSRANDGVPARSRDGWGSAQAAAAAEDVLTRMRRKQQDEQQRPCSLAGWMGIGADGGGGRGCAHQDAAEAAGRTTAPMPARGMDGGWRRRRANSRLGHRCSVQREHRRAWEAGGREHGCRRRAVGGGRSGGGQRGSGLRAERQWAKQRVQRPAAESRERRRRRCDGGRRLQWGSTAAAKDGPEEATDGWRGDKYGRGARGEAGEEVRRRGGGDDAGEGEGGDDGSTGESEEDGGARRLERGDGVAGRGPPVVEVAAAGAMQAAPPPGAGASGAAASAGEGGGVGGRGRRRSGDGGRAAAPDAGGAEERASGWEGPRAYWERGRRRARAKKEEEGGRWRTHAEREEAKRLAALRFVAATRHDYGDALAFTATTMDAPVDLGCRGRRAQ